MKEWIITDDFLDELTKMSAFAQGCLHELIRCKDCKWGKEGCGNIECWTDMNLPPEYHGYGWYCPNGERKEE